MGACERYAAAHGCDLLRLEVRADNAPALALYEQLGFRQFGAYEAYYADGAKALRFEKPVAKQTRPAAPRNK
jgi:ribosomal-protein-alanine N-acetyltransferase